MIHKILRITSRFLPTQKAYTHCDIPCGIYDPYPAQIAGHSVIRMTIMINDLQASSDNAPFEERKKIIHQIARLTKVKEEHAEIVKHEIIVIWGDYFKPEMLKDNKNMHELVFNIMKLASKAKQEINIDASLELLSKVHQFAEIFWKSKKRETVRVASSYPTAGELVVPK